MARHQTMLINEYRLSPIEPKSRSFLEEQMEKFFFGEGSDLRPTSNPQYERLHCRGCDLTSGRAPSPL